MDPRDDTRRKILLSSARAAYNRARIRYTSAGKSTAVGAVDCYTAVRLVRVRCYLSKVAHGKSAVASEHFHTSRNQLVRLIGRLRGRSPRSER